MSSYSTNVNVSSAEPQRQEPPAPGRVVAGVFPNIVDSEEAISELKQAGFATDQIGVAVRDRTVEGELIDDPGARAAEGAIAGALGGGLVGGLTGLLAGIVALAVPGLGPVLAGGLLAATFGVAGGTALAGAGIGVAAGGIIGALINLGIPEEDARYFETGVRSGGVLVTVNAGTRSPEALYILQRNGADTGAAPPVTYPPSGQLPA